MDDILHASTCEVVTAHVHSLFRIKDMGPASEFLNIKRITPRPSVIAINQGPSTQAKYPMCIVTHNSADVLQMTEYIHRDAIPTSPKQLEYVWYP